MPALCFALGRIFNSNKKNRRRKRENRIRLIENLDVKIPGVLYRLKNIKPFKIPSNTTFPRDFLRARDLMFFNKSRRDV